MFPAGNSATATDVKRIFFITNRLVVNFIVFFRKYFLTLRCGFRNNAVMNTTLIQPAELAVQALGGVRSLARLLGRDPSAVSRWKLSGHIPASQQRRVLELAWERGIDLTAHDIIFGRQA